LKHGSHLPTLFGLVENYIKLRFLVYQKLFRDQTSQNEKRRVLQDSEGLYSSLSGLDLTYYELAKLLINENEDEEQKAVGANRDDDVDGKNDIVVVQNNDVEELFIENKIAIIYYVLHHNEMVFEYMEGTKGDYLAKGFEVAEIEIQRFKDLNLKELLNYAEYLGKQSVFNQCRK
jgi:hypothetical protein